MPPITVTVTEDGKLYWNDSAVTRELLESQLAVEAQKTPQPEVNIRGDETTKYRIVSDVVNDSPRPRASRKVGFVATKERPVRSTDDGFQLQFRGGCRWPTSTSRRWST